MIQDTVVIGGECSLETRIEGDCDLTSMVEGDPDVLVVEGGGQTYPHYSGSYTVNPSTSQQVLQTDGKVMDDNVTVQAVPQGSATTPATIITANPSISVSSGGLITATVSKTQQITPTVVEGYVETGTPGNVGVSGSNTEQLSVQAAQTIHPASTDQSIASGKYLTGAQTFKAVTVSGLTADKILQGNTVKIGDADDDDRIMKVVGTATGGITPTGTKQITANGQGIDVYSYQYADVAVPNSYSAGDEGKVVSNGALVAQTSDTVTANDTYDTTLINSLTVNVSGGSKTNIDIGIQNTPIPNILNMFYALESGTAKTGEYTPATALPNTRTALFDTELSTVHGLFIADESQATLNTGSTPENMLFGIVFNPIEEDNANNIFNYDYAQQRTNTRLYQSRPSANGTLVSRGKWDVTSGVFYYTAPYNKNDNYSAFHSGHTYRWVAW